MIIETRRLRLILQSTEQVLARVDALSPAARAQVSPVWLARVQTSLGADPWTHGFAVVSLSTGAAIGECGYKGPPDAQRVVEIAYGVKPDCQGRGYATEAAGALVDLAFRSDRVEVVRAHTLPGNGASARVLAKCGFERVGDVIDEEDGMVSRWELRRPGS
jgi:RimJ/RimL family protein N-acetyltransferase